MLAGLSQYLPESTLTLFDNLEFFVRLLLSAALGALVLGLCYGAWYCITPDQCLPTVENVQRVMNAIAASPYSS